MKNFSLMLELINWLIKNHLSILFFFPPFLLSAQTSEAMEFIDPRDQQHYSYLTIEGMNWFLSNLNYHSPGSVSLDSLSEEETKACGRFYPIQESQQVCPAGWRLPSEKEIIRLLKKAKKNKYLLSERLQIELCGRIDYDKHAKMGLQNTFWLSEPLEDGHTMHWHTFGKEQELHSHDVVNARRKFPIRCMQLSEAE